MLCATAKANAQVRVSGKVIDDSLKLPIAGATVYFTDLKKGTTTTNDGTFTIPNLRMGDYLVEVSNVGFKTIVQRYSISQDTSVQIEMKYAVKELTEIIVTGVTRSTEILRSPVVVKAVERKAINERSATNIIDALKWVPGVNQITTGASVSKPVIRGMGYNRLITLNNGMRQEGQQWGDEHGIEIDENSIDRVEIVKGPGSLMYGSDGIAGVINFLPPRILQEGTIKTSASANYQTNNNLQGYSVSNEGHKKDFQWLGRLSTKQAGNYKNAYDGKVYNSGFKELNGNAAFGIHKTWGHSILSLSSYNATTNLVEGDRDENGHFIKILPNGEEETVTANDLKGYKTGFPHQKITHNALTLNNYFILKPGNLHFDAGLQNNIRKEFAEVAHPDDAELIFDLLTFNYNARFNFQKKRGWETTIGTGGMVQRNENKGAEYLIPDYHILDAGVFVFTQRSWPAFTLAGGLRFDNRHVSSKQLWLDEHDAPTTIKDSATTEKFAGFSENYGGVSGSIGMSYKLSNRSTLKLNISRGFRAPNLSELASNGRHEGAFRYEIGNAKLKPEKSHQFDLSYYLNTDHITLEVTPFINLISDYIFAEKLTTAGGQDSIPDPADPAPAFKYTSGNAALKGGEIYFDLHPHPLDWLHFENTFSFVQATQHNRPDSTRHLPFIPAARYSSELKARFTDLNKNIASAYISFGMNHYFKQNRYYAAYGTETATPAYTLLHASLGAGFKNAKNKEFLSLHITGENLTDKAYQSHLSRLKYAPENVATGWQGVFNMGRNFGIKLLLSI